MSTQRGIAKRPGANGRTARRQTAWDDQMFNSVSTVSTSTASLIIQNTADPEKRGCTVVRILVHLWLHAATPGAASGQQQIELGIAMASDDAFVGGALPDVETGDDFPIGGWLWRDVFLVIDETLANGPVPAVEVKIDLRSQRKLDRASIYLATHHSAIEGTDFNIRRSGIIRSLYKLP